jgi:DNA-binding CsgD family transcriptional regulator
MRALTIQKRLTPRQIFILQMIVEGKTQKQIALELGISRTSVKVQMSKARSKTGAESIYQLVAMAILLGWCRVDVILPGARQLVKSETEANL